MCCMPLLTMSLVFFQDFFDYLRDLQCDDLIINDDFNLVLDLDKDKNGGRHKTRTRSATTLNCRTRYAWKVLNPDTLGARKT